MSERNLLKRAKSRKGKKALRDKAPKLTENTKKQLLLRGNKASPVVLKVLQEFHWLRVEHSNKLLNKKETKRPFEDISNIELVSRKQDASLFFYGSHSKKRKHNLIVGRMFDYQLLDMVELGVDEATFKTSVEMGKSYLKGSKPALVFHGEPFDNDKDFQIIKNLFLDILRGVELKAINMNSLNRVIVLTATKDKRVLFRQYSIKKNKSGEKCPHVDLEEMGPHIDFKFRRREEGSLEMFKLARKKPKKANKTKKNISLNAFGERQGTIHMHRQNLERIKKLKLKKAKALRGNKRKQETDESQENKKQKTDESQENKKRKADESQENKKQKA